MIHEDKFNLDDKLKITFKNSAMQRIQHDLRSPSSNIRLRASNALKSPSIIYYNNFDNSNGTEEIDFNDDKRLHPNQPQKSIDIKDVMKNVRVYVEIRNGEINHSAGIKTVISQLGAKVNDRFLRDTTHVVFKDGLQSTYDKAIKWKIPLVSILWIEACKKNIKLMDYKLYPISNQYRYENPELFEKIKRVKYIETDSEDNTINTKTIKNINTPKKIRSSVRMPKKPRDSLNAIFVEFQEKLMAVSDNDEDDEFIPFQSKLLERIRNSPSTANTESKSTEKNLNRRTSIHNIDKIELFDNNTTKISTPQRKISRKSCIGFRTSDKISNKTTKNPVNENLQKKIINFFPKQIKNQDEFNLYNDDISEKKENMSPSTPQLYKKNNTSKFIESQKSKIDDSLNINISNKHFSTPINIKYKKNNDIIEQLDTITEDPIIFNSNKKPSSRRKTIFECSMDIIDKSLYNINKLSKLNKSLVDDKTIGITTSPLASKNNCTVDTIKSLSLLNISSEVVGTPKKRKLFVPEQMLLSTPTGKEIIIDRLKMKTSAIKRKPVEDNDVQAKKVNSKRRRTINVCTSSVNPVQQQNGKKNK